MNNKTLLKELTNISKLKDLVLESLKNSPPGKMRSEMSQGKYPQYYEILDKHKDKYPHGRYIGQSEKELAQRYAQKEYDMIILNEIEKREKEISKLLSRRNKADVNNAFNKLSFAKRLLISPYILPDDEYIKWWNQNNIEVKNTIPYAFEYITEKGERVRSKSEKMIADKLFLKGVPYKYEARLTLPNGNTVFPDFTLLNILTRKEIYLEHFGMMDNPEYCKNALEKIEKYESMGLFLGKDLFISMESSLYGINLKQIDSLIELIISNQV